MLPVVLQTRMYNNVAGELVYSVLYNLKSVSQLIFGRIEAYISE